MCRKQPERPLKRRRVNGSSNSLQHSKNRYHSQEQAMEYQKQSDIEDLNKRVTSPLSYKSKLNVTSPRKRTSSHLQRKKKSDVYTVCNIMAPTTFTFTDTEEQNVAPTRRSRTQRRMKYDGEEDSPLLPSYKQAIKIILKEREETIDEDLKKLKAYWKISNDRMTLQDQSSLQCSKHNDGKESNNQEKILPIIDSKSGTRNDEDKPTCDKHSAKDMETKITESSVSNGVCVTNNKYAAQTTSKKERQDSTDVRVDDKTNIESKFEPVCLPTRDDYPNNSDNNMRRIGIIKPMYKETGEEIPSISTIYQRQIQQVMSPSDITSLNQKNHYDSDDEISSFSLCCCIIL